MTIALIEWCLDHIYYYMWIWLLICSCSGSAWSLGSTIYERNVVFCILMDQVILGL